MYRQRALLLILVVAALTTIAVRYAKPVTDGDIWFHLAYGKYLVENRTLVPDHSVFSWTPTDTSRIYCVWISDIIFYVLYQAGGLYALYVLRYLLIAIFILLAASISIRRPTFYMPGVILICMSGLLMCSQGLHIKSEIFSFIFMSLMVWTWFRIKVKSDENPYLPYLIPLIMLFWVNSHGAVIFGGLFLGLIFAGEVLNQLTGSSEKLCQGTRNHVFTAILLSGLALFITPYGWHCIADILNSLIFSSEEFKRHTAAISEYQSIFYPKNFQHSMIGYLISSSGILLILLFAQRKRRDIDWTILFTNIPFIIVYMKFLRATYFWGIIFVFSSLYLMRKVSENNSELSGNNSHKVGLQIAAAILLLIIAGEAQYEMFSTGFNTEYIAPVEESRFIRDKFPHLRIGNDYLSGSYLIWTLWPDNKVFIDARYFPYHAWYDKFTHFCYGDDNAFKDEFLKEFSCDLWCVSYSVPRLIEYFMRSPDWSLVYYGPSACIFRSSSIPYPTGHEISPMIYKVNSFHAINITSFALMVGDLDVAENLFKKLKAPLFYAQHSGEIDHLRALIDSREEMVKSRIGLVQKALATQPGNAQLIQLLVMLYVKIADYDNAATNLKKLANLNPEKPDIYYNIACMYAKMENVDESLKWLEFSVRKGFNNWELIRKDPDLENIRSTAFVRDLIAKH
jgi:tetratricopeptide (TPR) repeat protein